MPQERQEHAFRGIPIALINMARGDARLVADQLAKGFHPTDYDRAYVRLDDAAATLRHALACIDKAMEQVGLDIAAKMGMSE